MQGNDQIKETESDVFMMSESLRGRLDESLMLQHDVDMITCSLEYEDGSLSGKLEHISLSDLGISVEVSLSSKKLKDALVCSKFKGVCINSDNNKVYHRDIESAWVQIRDLLPGAHAGDDFVFCLSARQEDK